ncbi:Trihelix transcription factor GT-2 [Camellia lanceoleosa]|uniref:Trihelix transcription factor GT-2 n=1 Tax=Camellia lanceoleosa TaxID=1840588 RepID=A0ACC0GKK7_9ERIC|nr:Trihelix transcription factor GT-2 [Camellia lanceoleosa]
MEVFTGDRQLPNDDVEFPVHLTPFPEASHILYDDGTAEIPPPPETEHHSQPPPQKLRPIRCHGRTLPEYSYPTVAERSGGLLSCDAELGFLTQLLNGGSTSEVPATQQKMKSEINAECLNLISAGSLFEAELSSSSDDDGDSSEAMTEPSNRKRKRRTRKKLELYLENMMRKVIQRQEQMHKQLIEMIEKKEKERIQREEAWKQQEIERAKKDEELRAQERSRSLALISFIQNLLGHEIEIPKSLETSCLEKDECEIHDQKDLRFDPCNKRWPKSEVQALITVRTALDHKFQKGPKGSIWEEVSVGLSNMGYSRSAKKCKEKWENINKYYKRTMENGKKRPDNGKTCPYFHELDTLYKSGLVNPGNACLCIKNEIEDKTVEE